MLTFGDKPAPAMAQIALRKTTDQAKSLYPKAAQVLKNNKSRVAPPKPLTIPRLELQAAILATRLYQSIAEESRMQFEKVVFFSDSSIILSWILSQAREFKPFASAQVAEIQTNSHPSQWRHVPGELNVADDVSRGILAQQLIGRWKQGPEFL